MERKLDKFMEKVKILNKDISEYFDEERGELFVFNTVQLLTKVEKLELDEVQLNTALFEMKVDKLAYEQDFIERPTVKERITKDPKDKHTLCMEKVKVSNVWNVSNGMGLFKSFNDKAKAIQYARSTNEEVKGWLFEDKEDK